ncbi:MAG: DEAD/DEAH box helicase [Thiothrix sp.]|nr:DEAD/DEAH box helicase [Thiothrix sp.]
MENQYLTQTRFDTFKLAPGILQSLQDAGFEYCSRIQAESLPLSLAGKDVTGQAQTGTGKTGAFLVAAFQRLLSQPVADPQPGLVRCLIMAPTRELALQIARDAETLGKHTGLRSVIVYGGAGYEQQRRQFEQPVDLLIGTPGRIIDYWKQRVFTLKQAQVMVLDEADRMFDMGFIQDVRYLLRKLPPPTERLNMLFSATLSHKVLELAYEHMNSPATVKVEAQSVSADNIHEFVYLPANKEKIPLLVGLIRKLNPQRAIVFVNTKHGAERIEGYLLGNGIGAALISGDVRQKKRERLLKEFADGQHQVLIATDVAARGLHIPDVSHIFNFDLPQIAEDYVHRIGRTARAGASGEAHSFACEDTAFYLPEIEEYIGKPIPVVAIEPELLPVLERPRRIQRDRVESGRRHSGRGGREGGRDGRRERRPRSEAAADGGEAGTRTARQRRQQGASAPAAGDGGAGTATPVAPAVEVMASLNPSGVAETGAPATGAAAVVDERGKKKRRRRRQRPKSAGDGNAPGAVAGNTPV